MTFVLRDDQESSYKQAQAQLRAGIQSLLLQAPTGFGKTVIATKMLQSIFSKGKTGCFVMHRRELVNQTIETFRESGLPFGVIARGWTPDRRQPIQIASIDTLVKRFDYYPMFDAMLYDEAHHMAATKWVETQKRYRRARHIGMTATPQRLDGRGLDDHFEVMVPGPQVRELVARGSLVPYRLMLAANAGQGMEKLRTFKEVDDAVAKHCIVGDSVTEYRKHAMGRRAIMFCHSLDASKQAAEQFRLAGVPAEHVDGDTDDTLRDAAIRRFRSGETWVLCNQGLFGEGFDVPCVEAIIDANPSDSLAAIMQRWGRGARTAPRKTEYILLDQVGNTGSMVHGQFVPKHGLPDDERTWSLEGTRKKKGDTDCPVRQCPKCYASLRIGIKACGCGHVFTAGEGRKVEYAEGELHQFDTSAPRASIRTPVRDEPEIETLEGLIAKGRERGYKKPESWAAVIWTGREINRRRAAR